MRCDVLTCPQSALAKGLCQFHYDRRRRYPNQPLDYIRPATARCADCFEEFVVGQRGAVPETCRSCQTKRHRIKSRIRRHRTGLREYGLTPEQFREMSQRQGNRCTLCGSWPNTGRGALNGRLSVDHDHTTGQIRGLLCHSCNAALGLLREDPVLMRRAAEYVERSEAWAS